MTTNAIDKKKLIEELAKVVREPIPKGECGTAHLIIHAANAAYDRLAIEILKGKFDLKEETE